MVLDRVVEVVYYILTYERRMYMTDKKGETFYIDEVVSEYITKVAAEHCEGNRSQALRKIIREHRDGGRGWKFWQKGRKC